MCARVHTCDVWVSACVLVMYERVCVRRLAKAIVSALNFEPTQRPSADNLLVCARVCNCMRWIL